MPDSDIPTEIERDLAGIEASIEADAPPLELSQRLQALSIHVGSTGLDRLRFLIARATVENRLALASRALGTLIEARQLAAVPEGAPFRSRISRAIATVHAWRGRGERAGERGETGPVRGTRNYVAPELLRSEVKLGPDPRQDIYAFGRMLDEFLPDRQQPGIMRRLGIGRADALQGMRRAMVAADPGERPHSLTAVAAELDRARPS